LTFSTCTGSTRRLRSRKPSAPWLTSSLMGSSALSVCRKQDRRRFAGRTACTRDPEQDVIPVARELGIGFVAYSPLGRGILSGAITSSAQLPTDDWRATVPRFQGANLETMIGLAEEFRVLAAELAMTPAQLALAWLLGQGPDIVPIPGTRSVRNLELNSRADDSALDAATLSYLERLFPLGAVRGDRYPPGSIERINL
jgi:diketogulonate reductase-like aldo/keto reductase